MRGVMVPQKLHHVTMSRITIFFRKRGICDAKKMVACKPHNSNMLISNIDVPNGVCQYFEVIWSPKVRYMHYIREGATPFEN